MAITSKVWCRNHLNIPYDSYMNGALDLNFVGSSPNESVSRLSLFEKKKINKISIGSKKKIIIIIKKNQPLQVSFPIP
jgi:hypothetical protein